jgi:hypothetical protein
MTRYDPTWEKNYELVRNSGSGFRHGNLVSDFNRVLQSRLFSRPIDVVIRADDPDYVDQAEDAKVVASSITRIANLTSVLHEAVGASLWASTGWMEVGHPLDQWSNDMMRSVYAANVNQSEMLPQDPGMIPQDEYVPISQEVIARHNIDVTNVLPFNPLEELPSNTGPEEPAPVFNAELGYPWLVAVDPRLIVIPPMAKRPEDLDYICRLRFMTRKEIRRLRGHDVGERQATAAEYKQLFEKVHGMSAALFPEMYMVAEIWIRRDRNNPEYNNFYLCYLFSDTSHVLSNGINPYGGMMPPIPVKTNKIKGYYDSTLADELSRFADMFDISIKAVYRKLKRLLNEKWLTANGAGLKPDDEKRLNSDEYRGSIKVNDVNAVQKLKEDMFDQHLLTYMNLIKGLAQTSAGASDIDRGSAVKDISAKQTQALLDATGINIQGMKSEIAVAAREAIMKLMHLVGLYNSRGRTRKYVYGSKIVTMERGTQDFTSSFIYDIGIEDSEDANSEKMLMWNQFLRTLMTDSGGVLIPYMDPEELAKHTVRVFGLDTNLLASQAAGRPGTGPIPSADPQVQAMLSGGGGVSPGTPEGMTVSDLTNGQHPERMTGSRGVDLTNAMVGMSRVGMGR